MVLLISVEIEEKTVIFPKREVFVQRKEKAS